MQNYVNTEARAARLLKPWRGLMLFLISVCAAGAVAWLHPQQDHFATEHWLVRVAAVSELNHAPEWLIVDARSRELYDEEHIPNAIWLAEEDWDSAIPDFLMQWQPERPVIIYCGGAACAASKRVALRLLKDLPEAKISVLKGGFPEWKANQIKTLPHAN
jgi:3-mercaptopyruvate sulfurtransferase SseA